MVDQRVAAEKQNGVGTPYIPPMTRRLKCRIDPEQSYELANKGTDTRTIQAYLGHRNISSTVRYTELSIGRFKGLFHD